MKKLTSEKIDHHYNLVLPSVMKVNFKNTQEGLKVYVSVKETKSSFLSTLKIANSSWDEICQVFSGADSETKNDYLRVIKQNLIDIYKGLWGRGEVTAGSVATSFGKQFASFVQGKRRKTDLAIRKLVIAELEAHLGEKPGRSKIEQEVFNSKLEKIKKRLLYAMDTGGTSAAVSKKATKRPLAANKIRVRYVIRKSRTNKLGLCPLDCRVRVNGILGNAFSTGIFVAPYTWDSKFQSIRGNEAETAKLIELRDGLTAVYNQFRSRGKVPSPTEVIDHYFNNSQDYDKRMTVEELFHLHLKELRQTGRKKSTLARYERICRNFEEHSQIKFVDEIRPIHIRSFWKWMKHIRNYSQDYSNKSVQALYGPFELAISHQVLTHNPCKGHRLEWESKLDLTCLDAEELQKLRSTNFQDKLQRVADSFLFMCYTGLHVGDYLRLTDDNIKSNMKVKWIEYDREKTGKPAIIPLHPVASSLIRKYGSIATLPRISAQKANDYLKVIAAIIGTEKVLTNKVARKTFTDMSINERGMSFESVAGMLGHTSTRFVRVYGKVRHQRILTEWKA
ncbi:hypothetical protein DYBT9623_00676 [Dyadobacter sp. CECT 9623]|uniref:Uncharacterized protein n=1 Tax=Dyadobacter linearis TaxID=2823330 RepID=A0ABM8UKK8_9BACT|nr:site-specific integrase [Dyadobacter sp. CECT 9623]CAG5067948.1 hypothetical protein DYBT9623_00676 [Dyadobacter sp. CECT 9623]